MKAILATLILVVTMASAAGQTRTVSLPDAPTPHKPSYEPLQKLMRPNPQVASDLSSPSATSPLEGVRAQLYLVSEVSSKQPDGSSFQARLEEPLVRNGEQVLPKGTLFEGHVQTHHARHAMRPGSLFMTFDRVLIPGAAAEPVSVDLLFAESESVNADAEGALHPALSKKRLLIQLGGTTLAAKFADDLAQVAGGTAVSASTARYVGAAAATTFFLLQKGREVKLHSGDTIEVEFGRDGPVLDVNPTLPQPAINSFPIKENAGGESGIRTPKGY